MSKNRIAIAALVASIGVAGTIGASGAAAATPYDTAPSVVFKKKVKFVGKKAVVGTEACGTGTCTVTFKKAVVTIAGKRYKGKLKAPASLGPNTSANIKLKLPSAARNALGKGKAKCTLSLSSTNGLSASATRKIKIKA
jgi:hypothetical protein